MATEPHRRIAGVHVVLLGRFNPSILHPAWLATKGLIRPEEAEGADRLLVSKDFTTFQAGWLGVQAEPDRFVAHTTDAAHVLPLRDFVVGLFELLEHTPVRGLGINCLQHWELPDERAWHELGDRLAPKAPWHGVLLGVTPRDDGSTLPGLRSVVLEGRRPTSDSVVIRVKVEPSVRVRHGVYFETNEDLRPQEDGGLEAALEHLRREWQAALEFAEQLPSALFGGGRLGP